MHVGSILQQVLHSADPVEAGSKMEGSGKPPLGVTTIDGVGGTETLQEHKPINNS